MSTVSFNLSAQAREQHGKGASRRLRRENLVPAVIYGGEKAAASVSILFKDLVKSLENEAFYSHVLTLSVDGKAEQVVLKALQRHPVKGFPMHADFMRVDATHPITVHVPLHFINQEACVGIKQQGGKLAISRTDVVISTLPQNLPEFIEVDLANVEAGTILHMSDIKLPQGCTIPELVHGGAEHNHPIASILKPAGGQTEEAAE